MNCLRSLTVILSVCFYSVSIFAQSPASAVNQSEQEKKNKELEQKALVMLDELIETGRSFRLPENRCHILSIAANLLWRHDEKRARKLFSEEMNIVAGLLRQPEDSSDALPENFPWQFWEMRRQIIEMLAQHDPQLAYDFLLASRPPADTSDGRFNAENENYLEIQIVQQIAAKDPKRAVRRAEELLAAGKPLNLVSNILYTLRDKDFEAAQKLTELIFSKLQSESPLSLESIQFVLNLMESMSQPQEEEESGARRKSLLSTATASALIGKAIAGAQAELAAAKRTNDPNRHQTAINLLDNFKSNTSLLEKYAPAGLAALKRSWAETEQLMDPEQRGWETLNRLAEKGSAEALIEAAAKAPPEMRYNYHHRAAQIASEQGDAARARQIINDHVVEKHQRQQALQELDQQLVWKKIGENKFDEARKLMPKPRNVQEHVGMLVSMAQSALNSGKKEISLQLLDEAWGLVDGPIESSHQFYAQLQIAGAYLRLNPDRSFEIIEASLDLFNELFTAAATLESFESSGTFRNKEMILRGGGRMSGYIHSYSQQFAALSATDSERVQSLIRRFARPEMRVLLQLSTVQQLLSQTVSNGGISMERHYQNLRRH